MPHNGSAGHDLAAVDEWGWIDDRSPASTARNASSVRGASPTETDDAAESGHKYRDRARFDSDAIVATGQHRRWAWFDGRRRDPDAGTAEAAEYRRRRSPSRARRRAHCLIRWAATGIGAASALAAVLVSLFGLRSMPQPAPSPPTSRAAVTASTVPGGACEGLSARTVTSDAGAGPGPEAVIAAFDYAYYRQRSAHAAMRWLAPESGITVEALAAGIASVPAGTTHCVAITTIAETTAAVHLAELHPDKSRTDYLQVVNLAHTERGLLIVNIQKQG